jgi:hypothetical protein
MAAHGDATVTVGASDITYTDRHEQTHVVNTNQTFVFELEADQRTGTTGEVYKVKTDTLTCVDGYKLEISTEGGKSQFTILDDATAEINTGSLWFIEDDGYQAEWHIRTIEIDDIDQPTELTSAVLERVDNPSVAMTFGTMTMAQ